MHDVLVLSREAYTVQRSYNLPVEELSQGFSRAEETGVLFSLRRLLFLSADLGSRQIRKFQRR